MTETTMSGISMKQSHGELKRRLAEIVGTNPSRYSDETGVERHKRLTAREVDRIAEAFEMGLSSEPKQQTMDAIMIRLERDHRTGAQKWDASDLVAVLEALIDHSVASGGDEQ
jgi:hypothetical protein